MLLTRLNDNENVCEEGPATDNQEWCCDGAISAIVRKMEKQHENSRDRDPDGSDFLQHVFLR